MAPDAGRIASRAGNGDTAARTSTRGFSMMLSPDQVTSYRQNGFVVLDRAFSAPQVQWLRDASQQIVDEFDIEQNRTVFTTSDRDAGRDDYFFDSAEAVHCFLEEGALNEDGSLNRAKHLAINKIGHALHDLVPDFARFCRLPVIGESLRALGHTDPLLWQTMYIFKQPGIGGEVRWHQDASYLITEPPAVTGIWVALEDATRENGCLWMQPGQHRSPLREIFEVDWQRRQGQLRTLDTTPWCADQAAATPLEVAAGTAVLFHDHMPHYSSGNCSAKSRHAFTLHAADRTQRWSASNWLQRPTLPEFAL